MRGLLHGPRTRHPYTRSVQAAAFFDLDRTLLRRSSALALAGAFREHGVIGRGQLAKAAAWQLLFAARGAGAETVRKAAEDGLMILKGFAVDDLRALVSGRDGAGAEAARLPGGARARRPAPRPRRAGLHRLGDAAGDRRGARATSSASTVRSARPARSPTASTRAARCARATARGRRRRSASWPASEATTSPRSTAYSDSHTDLPFLEAVGNPVVVNPDRELRRVAEERGWPVLAFAELAYPSVRQAQPGAARDPARPRRGRRRLGGAAPCGLTSGSPRSASPTPTPRR